MCQNATSQTSTVNFLQTISTGKCYPDMTQGIKDDMTMTDVTSKSRDS